MNEEEYIATEKTTKEIVPVVAHDAVNIPPRTTAEQDLKTKGQRNINLIWEATQASIAVGITGAVIYTALAGVKSEILNTAFVLVISMYLVRTNHTKTGGVGGTESSSRGS